MEAKGLLGKTVMVTGGARRLGRQFALTAARAGADVVVHHSSSPCEAAGVAAEIEQMGRKATVIQADFRTPESAVALMDAAWSFSPLYALVNSAAIFAPLDVWTTGLEDWQEHFNINLTAPFLLCQEFARRLGPGTPGRIINILDWRALRPGKEHFPYTISKAALAALTRSLAQAFAPAVTVNGLALGAILPPADGADTESILAPVPAGRWAKAEEVDQAFLFLLAGPGYITGEIIHLDGGRHLV